MRTCINIYGNHLRGPTSQSLSYWYKLGEDYLLGGFPGGRLTTVGSSSRVGPRCASQFRNYWLVASPTFVIGSALVYVDLDWSNAVEDASLALTELPLM